jgi:hypothetical protein
MATSIMSEHQAHEYLIRRGWAIRHVLFYSAFTAGGVWLYVSPPELVILGGRTTVLPLVAGAFAFVLLFELARWSVVSVRRRPGLRVTDEGLGINYPFLKPRFYPWSGIESVTDAVNGLAVKVKGRSRPLIVDFRGFEESVSVEAMADDIRQTWETHR